MLLDRESGFGFEAVVDLDKSVVVDFKKLPAGVQPALFGDECSACERAVRNSTKFQEALARRGIQIARLRVSNLVRHDEARGGDTEQANGELADVHVPVMTG